jgi:hypothetical protein
MVQSQRYEPSLRPLASKRLIETELLEFMEPLGEHPMFEQPNIVWSMPKKRLDEILASWNRERARIMETCPWKTQ